MNNITISKSQMNEMINYTKNAVGFSYDLILENAAHSLFKNFDLSRRNTFAFVCGLGFKARVGLKAARILLSMGKKVIIFLPLSIDELDKDYLKDLELLKNLDGEVIELLTIGSLEDFSFNLNRVNTIIDAIMDINYDDYFLGSFDFIIETINRSRIYTISIDVPSGLDADTGQINTICVEADLIIAQQFLKQGLKKTNRLMGTKVIIQDIGIPLKVIKKLIYI